MANISNSNGQQFTVPDGAALSYLDNGFAHAGAFPPEVAPRAKAARSNPRNKPAAKTKEAPSGVPIRTDGNASSSKDNSGPVQPK